MFPIIIALSLINPLAIAKEYTNQGNHEESLMILNIYKPSKQDYNEYAYLKSINHFSLNQKKEASTWLQNLEGSFNPLPKRYDALFGIMHKELDSWKEGDLKDIGRDMIMSNNRLLNSKANIKTQDIQTNIVKKLDKLIKDQEDNKNGGSSDSKDQSQGTQQGTDSQGKPCKAAEESKIGTDGGPGKIDEKKLKKYTENWGTLPTKERERVVQEITRDLPPKFKPMIEEYFKALNKGNYGSKSTIYP